MSNKPKDPEIVLREELTEAREQLRVAVAACELVHDALLREGLYVTRAPGPRAAAIRALDAVRSVLGVTPSTDLEGA